MAIKTFADETTRDIFHGLNTAAARQIPQRVWKAAQRKLQMLNAADSLSVLAALPGNNFETLKYSLPGYYSIRVNDQYRILFRWAYDAAVDPKDPQKRSGNANDVEIADYHGGRR